MIRPIPPRMSALILLAAMCLPATARAAVEVRDAWLKAPLPGRTTAAGYATLENTGANETALVRITSPAARAIELHTTVRDGDMLRMRRLDELPLPPGEVVRLAPGGHHMMVFGFTGADADTAVLTFHFADGTSTAVEARIEDALGALQE